MGVTYEENFIINYDYINYNTKLISDLGIIKIFQEIACRHASNLGYGLNEIPITHFAWLVLGWKLKVFKRPLYQQKVLVKTWPRKIIKSLYYRDFEILDENGETLCIATSKWVLIDTQTHNMVLENAKVKKVFSPISCSVFEEDIKKINLPDSFENCIEYKISRRDIDANNHVNNTIYLSLAYECLPEDVYKNLDYSSIEIMYKNECKIDSTVLIKYCKTDDGFIVGIINKYTNDVHCVIKYKK